MIETPDYQPETEISADTIYWPMHMEPFAEETFHLSDKATGAFVRFLNFYVKRNGNVPFDEGKLCDRLRYKTVRSLRPVWDELCAAGVVTVRNGLVSSKHGDFVLEKVRKARKQKSEAGEAGAAAKHRNEADRKAAQGSKDVPGEYNGNTAAIAAETESTIEQNQQVASDAASNLKPETLNKKPPPTPTALKSVGGGGSDIDKIVADFYRIVGLVWGADRMEAARAYSDNDIAYAGQWLKLAGGNVEVVIKALDEATDHFDRKKGCPSSLGVIRVSMPNKIGEYLDHTPTTAADLRGPGRSNVAAIPAASPGDDTWLRVYTTAQNNGDKDILRAIDAFIDGKDIAGANNFARSVEAIVNGKKARAAA